jgi:gluconokinase
MVIVLMGVAGSGKTTVGRRLAKALGCPFHDGDDYHPNTNLKKMAKRKPLTDRDRAPWLKKLSEFIRQWEKSSPLTVLACSALKAKYRKVLKGGGDVRFIHLKGSKTRIRERLKKRNGHFFDPLLLDSQFRDLQEPNAALVVDVTSNIDIIVRRILKALPGWVKDV